MMMEKGLRGKLKKGKTDEFIKESFDKK